MFEANGLKYYTTEETGKILKKEPQTIRLYCITGTLKAEKLNGAYIISADELKRFVQERGR